MNVCELKVSGFRNLADLEWTPSPQVNILYGNNGQGKTNLLEALWLFTGGKSFRGAKDADMVGFGKEKADLTLRFEAEEREQDASVQIRHRRSVSLNGIAQPTPTRLAGHFCAVVFSPAHLSLIKEGPEGRRRFLDAAYCQLRPGYIATLSQYTRALSQRNALIKEERTIGRSPYFADLLDSWDEKLAEAGARVIASRKTYVRRLLPLATDIYTGLSGGKEKLFFSMTEQINPPGLEHPNDIRPMLLERLKAAHCADLAAGFTTVGPHRDDLEICIHGVSARSFGSQGQQRSAVLALKLAEASLLQEVTGESPIALLDDVMSELDPARQDYILNHLHNWQVFITCCDPSAVQRMTGGMTCRMQDGHLQPE